MSHPILLRPLASQAAVFPKPWTVPLAPLLLALALLCWLSSCVGMKPSAPVPVPGGGPGLSGGAGNGLPASRVHPLSAGPRRTARSQPDQAIRARLSEAYGRLPLSFEVNRGQADARVNFLARGWGYGLFLTAHELVLSLASPPNPSGARKEASRPAAPGFWTLRWEAPGRLCLTGCLHGAGGMGSYRGDRRGPFSFSP